MFLMRYDDALSCHESGLGARCRGEGRAGRLAPVVPGALALLMRDTSYRRAARPRAVRGYSRALS